MKINDLLERLIKREDLTGLQMQEFMHSCMSNELNDVQIASFLALMRMKGETVEELSAAAAMMMKFAHCIDLGNDLIDIVGTGGDGKNTFNISTISAFVAAAAGARVAKHGGSSVSSRSGSADLLMHAGFELHLTDEQLRQCMQSCGISFLFAPHFHKALAQAKKARQQLGIRSLFNFLGPLVNPARVKKQVVGVFAKSWLEPLARVLANLGSQRACVVNARDGLDEVSISAITDVVEYREGEFHNWSINPKNYDCFHPTIDDIVVDSPKQSLALAQKVLKGQLGAARDIVLLNSALAIYCAGLAPNFDESLVKAKAAIDSGEALRRFRQLKELTQGFPMNSILKRIGEEKRHEVELAKREKPLSSLNLEDALPPRDFIAGLQKRSPAIIAEIKKASPSKGLIRANFDVEMIAKTYEQHGASCLSVLTDKPFFQGDPSYLTLAKTKTALAVLRKDFIIDSYQIHESRALGADCILLIVAMLDDRQLHDYCQIAQELNMAVLVESHTFEEFQRALKLPTPLMGVNNRSLHSFVTNIETSLTLVKHLPPDKLFIAESGINSRQDIKLMQKQGINTFLIGESLMRAADIGFKLDELIGK